MREKHLRVGLLVLVTAIAGCRDPGAGPEPAPASPPEEPAVAQFQALRPEVAARAAIVAVIPLQSLGARICPSGDPADGISFSICYEPVLYNCTTYLCTDPNTRQRFLHPDRPNPECRKAPMQTEACSNDVTLPEQFVPTREMVHETVPLLYPEEALTEPLPGAEP